MIDSVVASLLNKYLGKYIQNLDTENLNVGIFSGNAVLTDLKLKPEALFELDLPIEVKAGHVGKITASFSITSLYSSPVEVEIEDVYIIASPVVDRKYDPEKEKATENAIKRKKLAELENVTVDDETAESVENQGFFESLATTIINNIKVSIKNIHVRYEDTITNPEHPFTFGIMLSEISAITCDNQWRPIVIDSSAQHIYKQVRMAGLSAYWNPFVTESGLLKDKINKVDWIQQLKNCIKTRRKIGSDDDLDFIIRPIAATAKLILNKETNNKLPKALVDFYMDEIEILFSRQQYLDALCLTDSFKLMAVQAKYRKYRPNVPLKSNYKAWWHFAYTAIVEERIRPYSWTRIKAHRVKYREYKAAYKAAFQHPDDEDLVARSRRLEDDLNISTISIARVAAKLELVHEAPDKVKRKKKNQGWFSWLWSDDETDSVEEEIVMTTNPKPQASWLEALSEEEKENMYKAIGYDKNKQFKPGASDYIDYKICFDLHACTFSLINYHKEVLKVSVVKLVSSLENRPNSNGFRTSAKMESFSIDGVSIENELVPIVTSDIGVYATLPQVFSVEFEHNPLHVDANYGIRLNVQPVEIVYDEHAVTEVIAFFQVPHITKDYMKSMAQMGLDRLANMSRAGLQHAIDTHQTFHLSVHMRSPYAVIPEYGTLHRGGNLLVVDLGELNIESELQPKNTNWEDLTLSEVESRLYDKFNITISDVKVLLADSGEDWHTAQTKPDSEFHILPTVRLQMAFFNTVKPAYKQKPQYKVEGNLDAIKLKLSPNKVTKLGCFYKNYTTPKVEEFFASNEAYDEVDNWRVTFTVPSVPVWGSECLDKDNTQIQIEPSLDELKKIKRKMLSSSVKRRKKKKSSQKRRTSDDEDTYYSASDHSDEELEEWAKGLDVPAVDDYTSTSNNIKFLGRFTLAEVVIDISKSADKIETPYLMLRIERLCADAAYTEYGAAVQASLGSIQLVDRIHTGLSGTYLEVLSSKHQNDLISLIYRKVDPSCPDFDTVYFKVEQSLVVDLSSLVITFDRTAVLYLYKFTYELLASIEGTLGDKSSNLAKSSSSVMIGPSTEAYRHPDAPTFIERLSSQVDSENTNISTKVHAVAKLHSLEIHLCENESKFASVHINELEGKVQMKKSHISLQCKLKDLTVQDLTEDTYYPMVLSIEDDRAFDLKYVNHKRHSGDSSKKEVENSFKLTIGRVQCIFLYKFITEITNFMEPFINPETTQAYTIAAKKAAYDTVQDIHEHGTKISLHMDIKAPTILVPQNSGSSNVIVLKLGDLSVRNFFEMSDVEGTSVSQHWDHIYCSLDWVQVVRGKLNLDGRVEAINTVIDPISLKIDLRRALPPHNTDLHYDLEAKLHEIKVNMAQQDLKVIMSILRENFQETGQISKLNVDQDLLDNQAPESRRSIDIMSPVIEIEEPLLESPEVSEIIKEIKFSFVMDGVSMKLINDLDDPLAPTSPIKDEGEGLARFEIGKLTVAGLINGEGTTEVKITLKSITMEDIREQSTLAVKKLIQSSLLAPGRFDLSPPMIDMTYKQTKDGNRQVDIIMETMRVNVCVPYMLTIMHFFTDSIEDPKDDLKTNNNGNRPNGGRPSIFMRQGSLISSGVSSVRHHHRRLTTVSNIQPPEQTYAPLKVYGTFKQPEIVLFAEPTNPHSRVVVLKCNCDFDYYSMNGAENLKASVKKCKIISGAYNMPNVNASMVLYPCDVEMTREREAPNAELKMEVKVTDIFLHLSPTTLHMFLDIWDIIDQDGKTSAPVDNTVVPKQYFDLWNTSSVSAEKWQSTNDLPKGPPFTLTPTEAPKESFKIQARKTQIVFEVENKDYHVPRMCMKVGLEADIYDWSSQLRLSTDLSVEISVFNDKLEVWEPLLEPVMEAEDQYRPWEVALKLVKAQSHPIACNEYDLNLDRVDEIDHEVHYWLAKAGRTHASSSETDTDSDTEMTIIKPKELTIRGPNKNRIGSTASYDSANHHSSIQGDSDSDDLLNTLSNKLDSLFDSDSSDTEGSEGELAKDNTDKPVFLTAKGPVQLDKTSDLDEGIDEIDNIEETPIAELCNYVVIDSRDQLLLNVTPHAMDIVTEIHKTFTQKEQSDLLSVRDLPGFEIFNETGVKTWVTISKDLKDVEVFEHWQKARPNLLRLFSQVHESQLHRVSFSAENKLADDKGEEKLIEIDNDEYDDTDGLKFISKALASTGHMALSAGAFVFGSFESSNSTSPADNIKTDHMHFTVEGFDDIYNVSYKRDSTKIIPLTPSKNDTNYCVVYDVDIEHGRKVVKIKSPLELNNHLEIPIQIYCRSSELEKHGLFNMGEEKNNYVKVKTLGSKETWNIPLMMAYHCRLFVAVETLGYKKSDMPIWWQDVTSSKDKSKTFTCLDATSTQVPFQFQVVFEDIKSPNKNTTLPKVVPYYNLHVYPQVRVHNYLPYDVSYTLESEEEHFIKQGAVSELYHVDLSQNPKLNLKVADYLNKDWKGSLELSDDLEEYKAISMETGGSSEDTNKQLSLSIHMTKTNSMDLYVYSPYWIVNKTSLPLQLRGSRSEAVYATESSNEPLMFRFKKHRRKKAKLRVYNSKWTASFSLDTVASNGVVICHDKERNKKYQFLLQIQLSHLKLTKIVTIVPYFLVVNKTSYPLRYMEENESTDLWYDLKPDQCTPYWPETDSMKMYVKFENSNVSSQHFSVTNAQRSVLRMDKGSALCVEVMGGTESSVTITFLPYEDGDAPIRIENFCDDVFLKLHQKNQSQVSLLSPYQSVLYTWDDPTSERTLMWNVYNRKKPSYPAFVSKGNEWSPRIDSKCDGYGEVSLSIQTVRRSSILPPPTNVTPVKAEHKKKLRDTKQKTIERRDSSTDEDSDYEVMVPVSNSSAKRPLLKRQKTKLDKVLIYWVSYLDGLQRVLVFTQDANIAKRAKKVNEAEKATLAAFLSLSGVGISLINSAYEEVAYMSLTSGVAMWQVHVKNKWKTLPNELAAILEDKWRNDIHRVYIEDTNVSVEADLSKMEMKKPWLGELRRVYNPALWVQYRQSSHHMYLHTKIHKLQLDNQLTDAYFPTVLYPSPLPTYIVRKAGPKPFIEFVLIKRQVPENNINTVKYAKVLVQEMTIKLDKGFMLSAYDIFSHMAPQPNESQQLEADLALIRKGLMDMAVMEATSRPQKIVFEYLHLSPLKLRISFSLDGTVHSLSHDKSSLATDIIDFFLNSVGATLTEMKEVELRMAYFEREGVMLSMNQLLSEVQSHYISQAVQQAYVLILGLDVLGNPYGLVKDFTQGLGDFFYEPFMGSIQSPDKFAENLVRGIQSLLGHTVGSVAGSVSLITGSLGKALAQLSFDNHYKKKRRQYLQQHPKHLPESLYLAGKGFVMGVAMGVSGVVVNPIRGAREEGTEGFFKGMGKGLLGLLTKPTGGVVDMVSMAFDGIQRAAEMGQDVTAHMRPPRFINPTLGLKPYSRYQAIGMRLMNNVKKGKYSGDIYWAHAALSKDDKADVCLISDKHVILLDKCRFWGDWDVEWEICLEEILAIPAVIENKLIFKIKRDESGYSLFSSEERVMEGENEDVLRWLQMKIERAIQYNSEL